MVKETVLSATSKGGWNTSRRSGRVGRSWDAKGQAQHAEGRTYVGNIRAVSREMDRSPGSLSLGLGQGPCMRVAVDEPGRARAPECSPASSTLSLGEA